MGRPKNPVPKYTLHKSSGQARIWLDGKDVYLGVYDTPESRAEYARIVAELQAPAKPPLGAVGRNGGIIVDEVLLAFWRHAERHYRRADGTPTNELSEYKQTFKPLRALYGHTPARAFGPLALKAVREKMVGLGWCRGLVNRRVNRIRRVFKWAAGEELLTAEVYRSLGTVTGLQRNRTPARETDPVKPVTPEHVRATLPFLQPEVRGMVELQLLTGMRPGEVCLIRPADIDTSGPLWVFRPPHHKLKYAGRAREVLIGPRARAVLEAFTPPAPAAYYFSARAAVERFHAERGRARKTPKYASHMARNATKRAPAPKRPPAERYTVSSYGHAVTRAVVRANRPLIEAGVDVELHVPHWHPNQLRHAHGTEVRRVYGLEAAQVALGHQRADVTQVYAEKNLTLAAKVAAEVG